MPDFFPTLCGLAGIPVPRSVEGRDLSPALLGDDDVDQEALLLMNFSKYYDWFQDGAQWRGVRTASSCYAEWLDGRVELFDLANDPLQLRNLAGEPDYKAMERRLAETLRELQARRGDELVACTEWKHWLDGQRRVVRNAFGELSHPESPPNWSLLG
jgi:arylsulfatase A-like enzyme